MDASLVMLFDANMQTMESVAFLGFRTNAFEHRVLQYGEGNAGRAGDPEESLIGLPVSHGCIRMRNRDLLRLFDWAENGMPVEIVE